MTVSQDGEHVSCSGESAQSTCAPVFLLLARIAGATAPVWGVYEVRLGDALLHARRAYPSCLLRATLEMDDVRDDLVAG